MRPLNFYFKFFVGFFVNSAKMAERFEPDSWSI